MHGYKWPINCTRTRTGRGGDAGAVQSGGAGEEEENAAKRHLLAEFARWGELRARFKAGTIAVVTLQVSEYAHRKM